MPDLVTSRIALIKKEQKQEMPVLSLDKRLNSFDEVELGFPLDIAVKEAQRCMNCGAGATVDDNLCVGCLTCVRICPFEVPKLKKEIPRLMLTEIASPVVFVCCGMPRKGNRL